MPDNQPLGVSRLLPDNNDDINRINLSVFNHFVMTMHIVLTANYDKDN